MSLIYLPLSAYASVRRPCACAFTVNAHVSDAPSTSAGKRTKIGTSSTALANQNRPKSSAHYQKQSNIASSGNCFELINTYHCSTKNFERGFKVIHPTSACCRNKFTPSASYSRGTCYPTTKSYNVCPFLSHLWPVISNCISCYDPAGSANFECNGCWTILSFDTWA